MHDHATTTIETFTRDNQLVIRYDMTNPTATEQAHAILLAATTSGEFGGVVLEGV